MNNDKIMRENTHKQEHIKKGHRCMRSAYGKMMNGTSLIMNTLRNRSFNTFNYFFMTVHPKARSLGSHFYNLLFLLYTGVLISPQPNQEGNKLQRQKVLMFLYLIYYHNWRNISIIYICNKTSIKKNILTIKQNTLGNRSG